MKKIIFVLQFLAVAVGVLIISVFIGQYVGNLLMKKDVSAKIAPPALPRQYLPLTAIIPRPKQILGTPKEEEKTTLEGDILEIKPITSVYSDKVPPKSLKTPPFLEMFKVQIGAFSFLAGADKVKEELKKQGYPAEVIQKQKDEKIFFIVQVGNFKEREEAEKAKDSLSQLGYEPFITK